MLSSPDLNTDKTIIIGLTGPLASGCTTVSKFIVNKPFEGCNGISEFMKENNYTNDDDSFNYDVFNETIRSVYNDKNLLEADLMRTHGLDEYHKISSKLIELHHKLRVLLEKREYTNSLDSLLDDTYKKRLRISCSSIIIYHLVKDLKELDSYTSIKPEKYNQIKRVYDTITSTIKDNNINIDNFTIVFKYIDDIFHHRQKDTGSDNNGPPFPTEDVDQVFKDVATIKQSISILDGYRELMQDFGDNIRSTGNPFDYPDCPDPDWIKKNPNKFVEFNDIIAKYIDYIIHFYVNSQKQFRLFVIDSFRNPMCIEYLRKRYARFYLISVLSAQEIRVQRYQMTLAKKGLSFDFNKFEKQDGRDKGELIKSPCDQFYMQNVDKCVQLSDVTINNDNKKNDLFDSILRYLALIFDPGCTKPTGDEMFMNMAYSMALKSNCISRQVGAVIEGKTGYVVGAGWNDVGIGQVSCGLRIINDLKCEHYTPLINAINDKSGEQTPIGVMINELKEKYGKLHYCFCFKDEITDGIMQKEINSAFKEIERLRNEQDNDKKRLIEEIHNTLRRRIKFKGLQYCKALHAEENAIIQASKIGGMGLAGGKLYTTTFPCELCAKKIQQVGIEEVIYVEPYPKNISESIYLQDGIRKVRTRQFEGVKGLGYYKLFKSFYDQKDWQSLEKDKFV